MKLNISIALFYAVATSGTACARQRSPEAALSRETAEAIVGRRGARFTFPPEHAGRLLWPGQIPNAYDRFPVRYWAIDWSRGMPQERVGEDPSGIDLVLRWHAGPTRERLLKELLMDSPPEITTFCRSCSTPAVITRPDSGVRLLFDGASLVFVVTGEPAIRRLFPAVPDSVRFARREWNQDERSLTVPVQRREP